MKINPFKPNHPVSPGMFAGRINEIQELEKGLFQAKNGYPNNYLITGERGIGKSSILNITKIIAEGFTEEGNYNFITIDIVISKNSSLKGIIELIERKLKRELNKIEKLKSFLDTSWDFVQRIKVMDSGIERNNKSEKLDILIDDFSYSLSETIKRITKLNQPKDGIVFLIDEADNSCDNLQLGYFLKTITENLVKNNCNQIMFILAGLPEVIEKLRNSHESSVRIFNHLLIKELSPEDRHYVIDKGIEEGNKVNRETTSINTEAKTLISTLSEGYPHFIQQFSFSAFDFNSDGEISVEDVRDGAFKEGGALDSIGSRYYDSAYNEQIKSDDYREVLSIMADNMNSWIKKSEITEKFSGQDHVVTDALKALTARKIILKNPSKRGEYRLQQRGFALWIKLFGERKK